LTIFEVRLIGFIIAQTADSTRGNLGGFILDSIMLLIACAAVWRFGPRRQEPIDVRSRRLGDIEDSDVAGPRVTHVADRSPEIPDAADWVSDPRITLESVGHRQLKRRP
jgi:hypothetical protein